MDFSRCQCVPVAIKFAAPLLRTLKTEIILQHLESLYEFYGEYTGVRMARKHLGWYCRQHSEAIELRPTLMAAEDSASQFAAAKRGFEHWAELEAALKTSGIDDRAGREARA